MKYKYKVSIIIPLYNQEELVIKALDSIPLRDDVEIIIVDDCSKDNSLQVATDWCKKNLNRHTKVVHLPENKGCGFAKHVGYDYAEGEYVIQLDSDDYLYTDKYSEAIDQLDGTDMVYINLQIDNGNVWTVTPDNNRIICSTTSRFIRKEFLGDHRSEKRLASDWFLNEQLQPLPHTDKYTNLIAYHYTFPREGSNMDLKEKGLMLQD